MDIRSHEGVGRIHFGMTRGELRTALGTDFESFRRSAESVYPCDHYTDLGCFVYYDDVNGLVNAVEFCSPAKLTLNGIDLFGVAAPDLLKKLEAADHSLEREVDGFTSRQLGISAWYPDIEDEPASPAESIIVFARGYYD